MIRNRIRRAAVVMACSVLVVALAPSTAARAENAPAVDRGESADATAIAIQRSFPSMSLAQAREAARGQQARKDVITELVKANGDGYGGAWFDPPSGVLHLATTDAGTSKLAGNLGRARGVKVATHAVARSFAALEKQADALRAGQGELGRAARGRVGIDVQSNQVTVALSAGERVGEVPDGVQVIEDPQIKTEEDAGCTARNACDFTIRAGATIWAGAAGNNVCSVGFTARNASSQRVVYTAGHCSGGAGQTWGTGTLPIGPMGAAQNAGAVDGAIISVTNSWFTGDIGGEIYFQGGSFSLPVKGVAPSLGFIVAGETVCLAANYTDPTGPNLCGTVGTNSDAAVRGMVRVDGLDACGGDSGGGWYWLPSSGNRYAYGIHSRSNTGCHGDQGGTTSWFSAVPTVKAAIAPSFDVELR